VGLLEMKFLLLHVCIGSKPNVKPAERKAIKPGLTKIKHHLEVRDIKTHILDNFYNYS
jgi:hypothetical protein